MGSLVPPSGTFTQNAAATHPQGGITVDTTNNSLRVHDGVTQGGPSMVWGVPQGFTTQTLTDASTISIAITAQIWVVTLTAARTIAAPTGGKAGTTYRFYINTAGYTPSWNTVFKFQGGSVPANISGLTIFDFYYDGTNFNCVGQSINVS